MLSLSTRRLPGTGADIASIAAYDEARHNAKHTEEFRTGCLQFIAALEAGNNGVTGGAWCPCCPRAFLETP